MSAFTVERTVRHRCRSYRISTSGDTVRDAIKSLDNEIAALGMRSPCEEEPGPVVLIDDIKRKERQTPAQLEPGVYRAVCSSATVEQPPTPGRIDKTAVLLWELVDASFNRINRFLVDTITLNGADKAGQKRLKDISSACGVYPIIKHTGELVGRYVGLVVGHRGSVDRYRELWVRR